jgi:hypothetical protein
LHAFDFDLTFRGRRLDCESDISMLEIFWQCRHIGSEYYFFAREGLGVVEEAGVAEEAGVTEEGGAAEEAGVAATWTVVPVVRESEGLTITLSDSVTPLRISD